MRWSTTGAAKDLPYTRVFRAGGDLIVVDEQPPVDDQKKAKPHRVGRFVDGQVQWVGKLPSYVSEVGATRVSDVHGRGPDLLFAEFFSVNGRMSVPTVYPVSATGARVVRAGEWGGFGLIHGVLLLGDSAFVSLHRNMGGPPVIEHVQGPPGHRVYKKSTAPKCKDTSLGRNFWETGPEVLTEAIAASPSGWLVAAGNLCSKEPALELWAPGESISKVVPMKGHAGIEFDPSTRALPGPGNVVWVHHAAKKGPIVVVDAGKVTVIEPPEPGTLRALVDEKGRLFMVSSDAIYARDDQKWVKVARLPLWHGAQPTVRFANKFWGVSEKHVATLEPGAPDPRVFTDSCTTPFVYLYEVTWKVRLGYGFPTTAKALRSFADHKKLRLVDFREGRPRGFMAKRRRVGVSVPDKATAVSLIKHLERTMKDETPKLVCYAPPKEARTIPIK